MKRIQINCTKYEGIMIKEALVDTCPFKFRTIKKCGEDSDCNECIDENIEFNAVENDEETKRQIKTGKAIKWFNEQSRDYREYYISDGKKVDIDGIVADYEDIENHLESEDK